MAGKRGYVLIYAVISTRLVGYGLNMSMVMAGKRGYEINTSIDVAGCK